MLSKVSIQLRFIINDYDFDLGAVVERFITGKITHVGSSSIDKNSQVEVSLRDISLMDTASKLIASTTISNAKTFPISYKLKYNPSDIIPHHTYAVSARISGPDSKLLFINDVQTRAELTGSPSPTIDIAVIRGNRL
jgi:putative lipoprotein